MRFSLLLSPGLAPGITWRRSRTRLWQMRKPSERRAFSRRSSGYGFNLRRAASLTPDRPCNQSARHQGAPRLGSYQGELLPPPLLLGWPGQTAKPPDCTGFATPTYIRTDPESFLILCNTHARMQPKSPAPQRCAGSSVPGPVAAAHRHGAVRPPPATEHVADIQHAAGLSHFGQRSVAAFHLC